MHAPASLPSSNKAELYRTLKEQIHALVDGEPDPVANMANCAALIFHSISRLNWAGFYLLKGEELVLGPFQGQPACIRIPLGKGVCGTAAKTRTTIRVPDVTKFPGHIACDTNSRSEIVVPLVNEDGNLIGVLDIDSPELNRFDADDQIGIEAIVVIMAKKI